MAPSLWARDTQDTVNDLKGVPNTLSSWDKCMAKGYCKWPVIIVIIIAVLVALSVLWCVIRCACCGLSCCCSCFRCCGCGGGSGRRRGGGHKHMDDNMGPQPHGPAYEQHGGYQPPPQAMGYGAPQYAQFEVGRKDGKPLSDDALPPMPSWDRSADRSVSGQQQHEPQQRNDAVEMAELDITASQRQPMLQDHAYGGYPQQQQQQPPQQYFHQQPNAPDYGPHGAENSHFAQETGYATSTPYARPAGASPPPHQSSPYQSYTPYSPPQEHQHGARNAPGTPTALTPGRPQQDSWTVV